MEYNAFDWYWFVTDSSPSTQVWSTLRGIFVVLADADYVAFLNGGGLTYTMDTFANMMVYINSVAATWPGGGVVVSSPSGDVTATINVNNGPAQTYLLTPSANINFFLPQSGLPHSLALGRVITVVNLSATFSITIKTASGSSSFTPAQLPGETSYMIARTNTSLDGGWTQLAVQKRIGTLGGSNQYVSAWGSGSPTFSTLNAAALADGVTGTGAIVLATSPTIVTPTLTTPTTNNGTFNTPTLSAPASTGGTFTTPTLSNPTITTPTITNGTGAGLGKVTGWLGGYVAGRYYTLKGGAAGTVALAANTIYFIPIQIGETHTFDRLAHEVTTAGTAANFRMAIYTSVNGQPSAKVIDGGSTGVSGTGLKTTTISQSLTPGAYWVAIMLDGTNTISSVPLTNYSSFADVGVTSFSAPDGQLSATFTYGAYPTTMTFGSGGVGAATYANAAIPILGVRA